MKSVLDKHDTFSFVISKPVAKISNPLQKPAFGDNVGISLRLPKPIKTE